jgi:NADH dehydrogenase
MTTEPTRIVILGGGFAGTTTALRLEQLFARDSSVEIVLVDAENFSLFTPLLPEVPSGSIEPKHIVSPLRALLRRTVVRQAEVKEVDLEQRTVIACHCGACPLFPIRFDHLVLAVGGVTNFFGLPGVAENALTMKSLADASALHTHVIGMFEHADLEPDPVTRREMMTFVVAGGGFAGVETVAELNDFVRGADRYYPRVRPEDIRMVLVHSGTRILPEVSESLSEYALKKLRSQGVEVLLGARIAGATEDRVQLKDGDDIPSQTLIWTAGVAPSPLLDTLDLPRTSNGKVETEVTLRVKGHSNVWCLGDCAAIPDLITGKTCAPTAQHALRQGRRLAENIAASIKGQPLQPFRFKPIGLLAGLGRRCAVAEIRGLKFSGFFAWWLWRTVYLLKLPGIERKVRVALDWTLDLFFPADIVYLRPLHSATGAEEIVGTESPLHREERSLVGK